MRKKQSIRTKLLKVILLLLFVFAVIMGMVSVIIVSGLSKKDSQLLMRQICDKEALRFDNKMIVVENSVDMIYEYANGLCGMKEYHFDVCSDEYLETIRKFAVSVADKTDGAMAVYFRYNPDMVGSGTKGFFWTKKEEETSLKEDKITDILLYNSNDVGHVGWYYVPKEKGEALWMAPYHNQNLDVFMISYIIPFYLENGEFVGVIGMDIDFNSIMEGSGNVDLYQTGKVALVDMSEHLVYYSDENGNAIKEKLSNPLYNHITTINKSEDVLRVTETDGSTSVICCDRLTNGMKIFVSVPLEEINEHRDNLVLLCIIISVLAFVVTMVIISRNTARIIKPLNKLAEITNKYAQGDWTENYVSNTSDEIQELSECISAMAKTTQSYIADINNIARTDALTGLMNRTYYLEYMESLTERVDDIVSPYAVVVMDLNWLKKVNDNYGHEMGDKLIKAAGAYISRMFKDSKVFRIGGDEFVAILDGADYENRSLLCNEFEEKMDCEVLEAENLKVSISYGMASYMEDGTKYEDLFRIADERMYEKKKKMKKKMNN